MNLTEGKGTYVLILHLEQAVVLRIGRLGAFTFAEGCYAYVGSAFGPGGLRGRLKHHLSPVTRPYWHIDYLRSTAALIEIWYLVSELPQEHRWADRLRATPGLTMPIPRFGASDCGCPAHLFHFPSAPEFNVFRSSVSASAECLVLSQSQARIY